MIQDEKFLIRTMAINPDLILTHLDIPVHDAKSVEVLERAEDAVGVSLGQAEVLEHEVQVAQQLRQRHVPQLHLDDPRPCHQRQALSAPQGSGRDMTERNEVVVITTKVTGADDRR
jgi:hypothetical protein